jgi:hypothetical protein
VHIRGGSVTPDLLHLGVSAAPTYTNLIGRFVGICKVDVVAVLAVLQVNDFCQDGRLRFDEGMACVRQELRWERYRTEREAEVSAASINERLDSLQFVDSAQHNVDSRDPAPSGMCLL